MLWYCSTRAPPQRANASVIGDGSAKWKIVTSPPRAAGSENGSTSPRRSSSIVSAKMSEVWPLRAQHIAHAPRAVANRVAAVRRRHPLVDDHRRPGPGSESGTSGARLQRQRLEQRRPELPQLLEPFELVELRPEVPGDLGRRPARGGRSTCSTKRSSVPPKSCRRSRASAASCDSQHRVLESARRPARPPSAARSRTDRSCRTARRRRPSWPAPPSTRTRGPARACRTPR